MIKPTRMRVAFAFAAACFAMQTHAATLDIGTASIADIQSAYKAGLSAEQVTAAYLARIAAYDKQGPSINAIIALNPNALNDARERDAERKSGKPLGALHGIPVLLKDNIDVLGLPTTAGSQLLAGSMPKADAPLVKKLRDAGAIILGKTNLGEFAGGGSIDGDATPEVRKAGSTPMGYSSLGGQTRNPHDLSMSPLGSSSGSAAAVAAGFAPLAIGTDTSGSVRGPAAANGVVGLRPTFGAVSTQGLVPLSSTFDTVGPLAVRVTDVNVALAVLSGTPPVSLSAAFLKGKRIGLLRDFMGRDSNVDAVVERAVTILKQRGTVLIDPLKTVDGFHDHFPRVVNQIITTEFKSEMTVYLRGLAPNFPHSFAALMAKADEPATRYISPQKAYGLRYVDRTAMNAQSSEDKAVKMRAKALKNSVDGLFRDYEVSIIVYPTLSRGPPPLQIPDVPNPPGTVDGRSALYMAVMSRAPDLVVPAGLTDTGLPVGLSFLGRENDNTEVLAAGADFEQAAPARRLPKHTPALASDVISY